MSDKQKVAVLCAMPNSIYNGFRGVEVFDEQCDARTFTGGYAGTFRAEDSCHRAEDKSNRFQNMIATCSKPCVACGKIHRVEAVHYDRVQTECGSKWFVLQPKRNGPLVLFPHPGEALTRWQLAEKEYAERADGYNAARLTA